MCILVDSVCGVVVLDGVNGRDNLSVIIRALKEASVRRCVLRSETCYDQFDRVRIRSPSRYLFQSYPCILSCRSQGQFRN